MHTRRLTIISYAVMAVFAMALTVTSPLLPAISASFALSMAESGIIFTASFVGFVAFILAGGILADHWGKKRVLAVALVGFGLSLLLMPLAPSFAVACAISGLIGGFGGILESQLGALIAALNPDRPSYYLNFSQVFFGVGALVGPSAAGLLLAGGSDWRLCYAILGALALALAAVFVPTRAPLLSATDRISRRSLAALLSDRRFLLICLCMLLYTGAEIGTWGWMSTFLKQRMAFSIVESGVAVGIFWVAMTAGRFLCGLLTLRFQLRAIIIGLACASALVTALSGVVSNRLAIWIVIGALGLTYSSQWPLILAYGSERYTASSGTVFALLVGSGGLGTTVIPYLMGVIGQYAGIRAAVASPAVLLLAIAAIMARIERPSADDTALGERAETRMA
ncbi:MAG: MFS transporter [Kouleothrix sp.]|nr:MFS transporter [Kouleothrix sp.]